MFPNLPLLPNTEHILLRTIRRHVILRGTLVHKISPPFPFLCFRLYLTKIQSKIQSEKENWKRERDRRNPRIMQMRTVKVGNVSDHTGEREIREFFSFSGDIEHVHICDGGAPKTAFVTFKDPKALEIAVLLSGATIVDQIVSIVPVENYIPKVEEQVIIVDQVESVSPVGDNIPELEATSSRGSSRIYVSKAQGIVTGVLARGSALRQDASAKVTSFDKRVGLSEKITVGISLVNDKVKSMDQKLGVSDKTLAVLTVAEQKLNDTGSAVKTSRYVSAGTAWLNGAFSKVAMAGHVASAKTKEKFQLAVSNLTAKEIQDPAVAV